MADIGFKPYRADPDLWIREKFKKDGTEYFEYVLIYVEDLPCISTKPQDIMETISSLYRLKEDLITGKKYDKPYIYLGTETGQHKFPEGETE